MSLGLTHTGRNAKPHWRLVASQFADKEMLGTWSNFMDYVLGASAASARRVSTAVLAC